MHFGMPTLLEIATLEESAALCRQLGLDFIELNMNLPEYQTKSIDAPRFSDVASRYGIYYTMHLDENLNPCDFNERVARAYIETMAAAIETAKKIKAPVLNMHLAEGVYFTLPGRRVYLFDEYERIYLKKLDAFRRICEDAIGGADIKICVENSNGYHRAAFLRKALDLLLTSPAFALTFDTGHNAVVDFADEALILERADRLSHLHIHDAKGKESHLPLGEGMLDLRKYLCLAQEHKCRVVLETKTADGLGRSVEWMKMKRIRAHPRPSV